MLHYVYRITNLIENKHYYGVRTCLDEPHNDLGIKYFSSSSNDLFLKDQKNNPVNYKYKIIKIFNTRNKAINFEIKLHNKFNVHINDNFINIAKQTSTGFDRCGIRYRYVTNSETGKRKAIFKNGKTPIGYINLPKLYCKIPNKIITITNGLENRKIKLFYDQIPDGWWRGVVINWVINNGKTIAHDTVNEYWVLPHEIEQRGLIKGRLNTYKMSSVKHKKLFNNGEEERYFSNDEIIPDTFVRGRLHNHKLHLYGPRSAEFCQKVSLNHADFSGSKHPNAKKYKLTNKDGEIFIVEGGIVKFCKEHKLNIGLLKEFMPNAVLKKTKNNHTIGWKMELL